MQPCLEEVGREELVKSELPLLVHVQLLCTGKARERVVMQECSTHARLHKSAPLEVASRAPVRSVNISWQIISLSSFLSASFACAGTRVALTTTDTHELQIS